MSVKSLIVFGLILSVCVEKSVQNCQDVNTNGYKQTRCHHINDLKSPAMARRSDIWLVLHKYNLGVFSYMKPQEFHMNNVEELEILTSINNNLDSDIFGNFRNLKILNIRNNIITDVRSNVFNSPKLRILILTANRIKNIAHCAFCNLPKLTHIYLDFNEITEIYTEQFSYLPFEYLCLKYNQITKLHPEAFKEFRKLTGINLSHNLLPEINARQTLVNMPKLQKLFLEYNQIRRITRDSFFGLKQLSELHLEFNNIDHIEPDSFGHTPNLKMLHLGHNQIKVLEENSFPQTGLHLNILYIDNNQMTFVPRQLLRRIFRGAPDVPRRIKIGGNPWSCACLDNLRQTLTDLDITYPCDAPYFSSKLPICVPRRQENQCYYQHDAEIQQYFKEQWDQAPLPPHCYYDANGVAKDENGRTFVFQA